MAHEKIDIPVKCNECSMRFMWSQSKTTHEADPGDPEGIRPTMPACPRCSFPVSMRQLKVQESTVARFARMAMLQFIPGRVHCCPIGVWGTRGGFMILHRFPVGQSAIAAGEAFDEALVRAGWAGECDTWIRSEFVEMGGPRPVHEGRQRGGVDHERILVHFDGRRLHWTPAMDWISVAPADIPEESRGTLA